MGYRHSLKWRKGSTILVDSNRPIINFQSCKKKDVTELFEKLIERKDAIVDVADRDCDRDQQAGWYLAFRGKPGRSSFARFSVEFRALERQIERISIVSRPEATRCFPESRDTIDFFQESPFVFTPLNICFVSPSPRLERGPSLMISLPDGRVLTPTERRKF